MQAWDDSFKVRLVGIRAFGFGCASCCPSALFQKIWGRYGGLWQDAIDLIEELHLLQYRHVASASRSVILLIFLTHALFIRFAQHLCARIKGSMVGFMLVPVKSRPKTGRLFRDMATPE